MKNKYTLEDFVVDDDKSIIDESEENNLYEDTTDEYDEVEFDGSLDDDYDNIQDSEEYEDSVETYDSEDYDIDGYNDSLEDESEDMINPEEYTSYEDSEEYEPLELEIDNESSDVNSNVEEVSKFTISDLFEENSSVKDLEQEEYERKTVEELLEPEKKDNRKIIFTILLLLLLIIIVVVIFLLTGKKDKKISNISFSSSSSNSTNILEEVEYEDVMTLYGKLAQDNIKAYYDSNNDVPSEFPEVIIEKHSISCEIKEIYTPEYIYLGNCSIDGSEAIYSYGTRMNTENSNSNSNSVSNSNTNSNKPSNSNSNKPTNTNSNKPSNTNTNSNKPTNTNSNSSSNQPTNTNSNTNTNTNTNTNVNPPATKLYDTLANSAKSDKSIDFTTDTGDGLYSIKKNETLTTPIYYYRGNVTNNYVLFAEQCWKIVRTTDTGGIKIIYSGTYDKTKGCNLEKEALIVARNQYSTASINKTRYSSSLIAPIVDNWYTTNIQKYQSNLEQITWCNDVTTTSYTRSVNGTPLVGTCPTRARTFKSYVGLLTVDEVVYAGAVLSKNRKSSNYNYLRIPQTALATDKSNLTTTFKNILFVTMSQGNSSSTIVDVGSNGEIEATSVDWKGEGTNNGVAYTWGSFGVRPVVSLKKDVTFTKGNGTVNNPYVIE